MVSDGGARGDKPRARAHRPRRRRRRPDRRARRAPRGHRGAPSTRAGRPRPRRPRRSTRWRRRCAPWRTTRASMPGAAPCSRRAGTVEMDASIMEGDALGNGAVACVTGLRNPITLARRILDDGRHSLLRRRGRDRRRRGALGVPLCDPAELVTDAAADSGSRRSSRARSAPSPSTASGTIAAGTSTGGTAGKLPGRVGDSPLIGCGTYAESTLGGVSCTGDGEAIIRVVARPPHARDPRSQSSDPDARLRSRDRRARRGRPRRGRPHLLDWKGRMAWAHSTPLMPVGLQLRRPRSAVLPF